jgi:PIN domain nuclease of toxin-antitoxin system
MKGTGIILGGIISPIDAGSGTLLLSVISVCEVGLLDAERQLELFTPCDQWVQEALATPGLTLVPLSPEIAVHSTRSPGTSIPTPRTASSPQQPASPARGLPPATAR